MSIECVQWAVERCSVKGPDKSVLVAIAYRAHADGTGAYPSHDRLMEEAGVERRTVAKSVKRLASAGYVTVTYKGGPNGSNAYTLNLGTPVDLLNQAYRELDLAPRARSTLHQMHSAPDAQCTSCQEPSTTCKVDLAPDAPKPSIQPSEEPSISPSGSASSDAVRQKAARGQRSKGKEAAKTERPKGVNLAEFYEALKAAGLPRIEVFGAEERAAGQLLAKYGGALMVECWRDIGAPGQPSDFADVYVQRQRTFQKLANGLFQQWLDWRATGKPCITKRGVNNGTGTTNTGSAGRGAGQRPGADGAGAAPGAGAGWHEQPPNW